ncbi:MAG: hypothetical protein M3227_07565, partial [Thermoproteota archaeon]|nr:hypothetical protein [Thermoproteota archaeon]
RLFSLSANSDEFINDNFLNAWVFWFHLLSKLFIDYNESEPNYPNKNIVYDVGRIIISQLMMCVICLKKEVRKQHYTMDGNSR